MRTAVTIGAICGLFLVGTVILSWVRYPECGTERVAAYAPYANDAMWVCVHGTVPTFHRSGSFFQKPLWK